MTQLLKNPQPPPLYDLLMYMKDETMLDLRVCLPAVVTRVDAATGLVGVQVSMQQRSSSGTVMQYPELTECPVVTIQGGGVGAAFPSSIGDACLVLFSDRCLDAWLQTGAPMLPPNGRTHDLSDGFVIVGINAPTAALKLKTPLGVNEGGICETKSLTGAKVAVNPVTHKVTIKNNTQNLFTALTDLTTAVKDLIVVLNTLTTTGGPTTQTISPATVAALVPVTTELVAVQTELIGLLY